MRPASRHPVLTSLFVLAVALGCGDMGCGCDMEPLDRDLDEVDKVYDGVLVEISPDGFDYISRNFDPILETLLPDGLVFDLPNEPGGCSCNDYRICNQSTPCPITAEIHTVVVNRRTPNILELNALLNVYSDDIPLCARLLCIGGSCSFEIHITDKPVLAEVRLHRDPVSHALTFDIDIDEVTLTANDFSISGGLLCSAADWDVVKNEIAKFVNDELNSMLPEEVEAQVDEMTCMACDYYTLGCEAGNRVAGVYCDGDTNRCMDPATQDCVRAPMGFAGIADLGDMLADFGGEGGRLAMHVGVGQKNQPQADPFIPYDGGPLDLRAITGAKATPPSSCVPEASTLPNTAPPPRVDFNAEAGQFRYHVGVGISDRFLNKMLYEAYKGGALCLNLGSDTIDLVSTGLFATFLPSLGVLTEGRNAPMIIAVRPKDRPEIHIGAGTYREVNGRTVMDEPLITLLLNDFHLDFYAFIEERFFRLFTLDLDIALPIGLELTAENQIIPIMGDLDDLVTRIEAKNSKILAEDPALLEDLIPALIGMIEPMLGGLLTPIDLPDLQGFLLDVKRMGGMVDHPEPGRYEHLGILAELMLASSPSAFTVAPPVSLLDVRIPSADRMRPVPGERLPRPSFVVEVGGPTTGPIEWQYRLNGGFWSPFHATRKLEIDSPKLLLQGHHVLEVRSRRIGDYRSLDPDPVRFDFIVDWEPPSARLSVDPATGIAEVFARDSVTPADRLEFAFAIDDGAFGPFGPDHRIELPIDATRLEVRVRDEAGNETELQWDGGVRGMHGRPPAPPGGGEGCGCAATANGGVAWSALLLLGLAFLPRRRR
jgi:uncharacterized protein (TIGR03382 family)